MYRFLLNTLRLTLTFIVLIIPPLLLGRAQPPDSRLTALHLTDCAPPCWIGIMPTQTTWRDAKILFRQTYLGHAPFLIVPNDVGGGVRLLTYHDVDEAVATVSQIFIADWSTTQALTDSALMPRLGDVLLLWGTPTCIYAYGTDKWAIEYDLGVNGLETIKIAIIGTRLSPHQPIYNFHFLNPMPGVIPSCRVYSAQRWHGLTNLR